ncbi:tripartite tricarboxylate transporter permease [Cognatishimia maritima]|uniref:Putative tricarboxylic transport membrane protein n=1 Tax=Cognatishimia maritima TaxID=870908 RepID=A0A1M5QWL3_9RHOB|nr:tripartite tricarboxylate transporter permease [Cognatishimia maritima]SHH18140.1 putative tricarboxylic transport membrane protein [Cognatishimia maritima]
MPDFSAILTAFSAALSLEMMLITIWATILGIVFGMLPGLTATMGLALLTTLTFKMESVAAITALLGLYVGAIYGGSRTAIILNMPGTPASAATSLDGYPLARQSRAREALGLATIGSFFGTMVGVILLLFTAPILADYALNFGSYEFFWLALFGVVISGRLTAMDDPLKGWIAGFLGLIIAMIGQEQVFAYARFSFDIKDLTGGVSLIPAMVGAFGLVEILSSISNSKTPKLSQNKGRLLPQARDLTSNAGTIGRSGLAGTLMGLIPGVGEDIGAWVSYAIAKRFSRSKELFGKGSTEGLIAAETGNSAAVPGAIIPVLTLAIPGSAPSAVLLAALVIHGVQPGPLIMLTGADMVYSVVAAIVLAAVVMTIAGVLLTTPLLMVLRIPRERLLPIIFVLCTVGAFAIASRPFDVWTMLAFGVIGFVLKQLNFPMAPLVLGLVLGELLDKSLRRGLILSEGSLEPFFTRPISAVLAAATIISILLLVLPLFRKQAAQR